MQKKQHNALRRMQALLSNLRMWQWESDFDEADDPLTRIELKLHPLSPWVPMDEFRYINELISYPFNWKVCARALCSNGTDTWLESVELVTKQTQIKKRPHIYAVMREEAMKSQQAKQIIDVGWIAQTYYNNPNFTQKWYYAHEGAVTEQRQMLYRYAQSRSAA